MDVGRHFNARGVTCFVLRYRLPGEGWANRSDVPLQDAQRAVRLVRANAAQISASIRRASASWAFRPAAMSPAPSPRALPPRSMSRSMPPTASAPGPISRAPMYPVVTMGEGCHAGSRDNLLGPNPSRGADRRLFLREACARRCAAQLAVPGGRRHHRAADAQCAAPIMRRCGRRRSRRRSMCSNPAAMALASPAPWASPTPSGPSCSALGRQPRLLQGR